MILKNIFRFTEFPLAKHNLLFSPDIDCCPWGSHNFVEIPWDECFWRWCMLLIWICKWWSWRHVVCKSTFPVVQPAVCRFTGVSVQSRLAPAALSCRGHLDTSASVPAHRWRDPQTRQTQSPQPSQCCEEEVAWGLALFFTEIWRW